DIFRTAGIIRIEPHVLDMDRPVFERSASTPAVASRPDWMLHDPLPEFGGRVVGGYHPQQLAVEAENERPCCPAQLDRAFGHGLEHRLQVEGGAAYDLEHVGGRGLLQQRFAQFIEQTGVLDRNYRLVGEV